MVSCPDCGGRTRVLRTTGSRPARQCADCQLWFSTREKTVGRVRARADWPPWMQELMTKEEFAELAARSWPG
jgi:hypothetical protein